MVHLPEEVVLNILFRLPLKSLIRFSCVCKRWRSLLSGDPQFTTHYHCEEPGRSAYLVRWTNYSHETAPLFVFQHILALVQDDQSDQAVHADVMSVLVQNHINHYLEVIGSIDGVFCLSYALANFLVLWNPATGDWHRAPHPNVPIDHQGSVCSTGFACDAYGSDRSYKVVRIVENSCGHYCEEIFPCCPVEMRTEVYDSRTDVWTEIDNPPIEFDLTSKRCTAIVKGVPYWSTRSDLIMSFDPSTYIFRKFDKPDFGVQNSDITGCWSLGEIEKSLAVFVNKRDKSADVWRMVSFENGQAVWSKMFSVGPVDGVDRWVTCWKDGEFLVASERGKDRKLNVYDPWRKKTRVLPYFGTSESDCVAYDVFAYVESLNAPHRSSNHHVNGS